MNKKTNDQISAFNKLFEKLTSDFKDLMTKTVEDKLKELAPRFKNHIIIASDGFAGIDFCIFPKSYIKVDDDRSVLDIYHEILGQEDRRISHYSSMSREICSTYPLLKELSLIKHWTDENNIFGNFELDINYILVRGV